jgi:hypothetical protein
MSTEKPNVATERRDLQVISCSNCLKAWLAPGVFDGHTYICKSCGWRFVVNSQHASAAEFDYIDQRVDSDLDR